MKILVNPYRGRGLPNPDLAEVPFPKVDATRPSGLLARCPRAAETPLLSSPNLAQRASVAAVHIKDERKRMGLGSFKALGAAFVIAVDAETGVAAGRTYVAASAGNHGLSIAAGAAAFGAQAVIYLAQTVPEAFADRLRAEGAKIVREGEIYEDSLEAAKKAATLNGWVLLSDSSWAGYLDRPLVVMEGYLAMMTEVITQIQNPPTHLFLQAGVGGLAGACAALARKAWGEDPKILVVEPDAAPALQASIEAGSLVTAPGPVSAMGRLDCKVPSLIALKGLARDADMFLTITEAEGHEGSDICGEIGFSTTPSGAAGISALLASRNQRDALNLSETSRVLAILSEGPET